MAQSGLRRKAVGLLDLKSTSTSSMKPAAASSGQEMTTMMKIAKKAGFGRVVGLVSCCAGAGAGLWLYASGEFVRARQDAGTITVTGRESPFACSLEKSLTKEQRERKKQIAQKMASARVETKELENGYLAVGVDLPRDRDVLGVAGAPARDDRDVVEAVGAAAPCAPCRSRPRPRQRPV